MVQTPNALDTKHIYVLEIGDNFPLGIIPLEVDHKMTISIQSH